MKYLIFQVLYFLIGFNLNAQPTYLKKLSFNGDTGYLHPEDSILQLKGFSASTDGYSFVLIDTKISQTKLFKLDNSGNIKWSYIAGFRGINTRVDIAGLHSTDDGGCIYVQNISSSSTQFTRYAYVTKVDSLGAEEWGTMIPAVAFCGSTDQVGYDIAILPGAYACLSNDSIYILDSTGTVISNINFAGPGKLQGFTNGDLFISFTNTITNLVWRNNGSVVDTFPRGIPYFRDSIISIAYSDTLFKVDRITGAKLSSFYILHADSYKYILLSDSGWVAYAGMNILKYNNTGTLLWVEQVTLPRFGYNIVGEQSDGTLLIGGCFRSAENYISDYSSFIATIDTNGHGVIDSTGQTWPGDANDDGIIEFSDALYVALAQGSTGPQRYDSIFQFSNYPPIGDLAIDFAGSFGIGVNHKHADMISDGIIDSMDIDNTALFGLFGGPYHTPWRQSNPSQNSLVPTFSCIPNRTSVQTGDTIRLYYILGNTAISIDSIFGLVFQLSLLNTNNYHIGRSVLNTQQSSDLGIDSSLLFRSYMCNYCDIAVLTARKDLQNAYNVQDTIAYTDFLITDSVGGDVDVYPVLEYFEAITAGGFPITFQFTTQPFHLHTTTTSLSDIKKETFSIYPNPTNSDIIIDNLQSSECRLQIFNYEGKEVYSGFSNYKTQVRLSLEGYAPGIYVLLMRNNENQTSSRKFIKE